VEKTKPSPRRFAQVIRLKPEKKAYYLELHRNTWPCVLEKILECNMRNYSIYLHGDLLFAYFEYYGDDFEQDIKKMADDPCTQDWWTQTSPCQETLSDDPNSWWLDLKEVFHTD
jgi:L-rhamnose mutarotase